MPPPSTSTYYIQTNEVGLYEGPCTFCQAPMGSRPAVQLPCNHHFHSTCFHQWVNDNPNRRKSYKSCPECPAQSTAMNLRHIAINAAETQRCGMCFCDFPGSDLSPMHSKGSKPYDPPRFLRCNHLFHSGCIDDWLPFHFRFFRAPECPVCQTDIRDAAYDFMGELYQREVRMVGSLNEWGENPEDICNIVPREFPLHSNPACTEWVELLMGQYACKWRRLKRRTSCWEKKLTGELQREGEVEDELIWVQLSEKENELLNWELVRAKKELLAISNLLHELIQMLEAETEENKANCRELIQEIQPDVATIFAECFEGIDLR